MARCGYLERVDNNNREECFYQGHRICVEAEEVSGGAWTWRYVVAGNQIASASISASTWLPDAKTALQEGMAAARVRVTSLSRLG